MKGNKMRKRKKGLTPGRRKDRKRLQAKRIAKILDDRRNPRSRSRNRWHGLWRNRWYKPETAPKRNGRYKRWRAKNPPFRSYQVAEEEELREAADRLIKRVTRRFQTDRKGVAL